MKRNVNTLRRPRRAVRRFLGRAFRPVLERLEIRLAPANVDVLSYHYDQFLSGQNLQETVLHPGPASDPTALNATNFGMLFSQPIDGQAYPQPLYKANLAIPGKGTHNVAFIATEHDSVYAFDADSNTGPNADPLWHRSFIDPANGITTIPFAELSTPDIFPEIGITGTPVIDGGTNTLYVVVKTREVRSGVVHYVQKLHALDLATGADKFGGPYQIGDSNSGGPDGGWTDVTDIYVNGTGGGADPSGKVHFNAARENDRMALQLLGNVVYVAFASHADFRPYHGWVIGFDKTTLQPVKVFNTAPNADGVAIWQSGGGISFDGTYLYFAVGNGFSGPFPAFDPAHGNYSESVLKIDPTPNWTPSNPQMMTVVDYFTPYNWQQLDSQDADLGSGGAMLLPDSVGSAAHRHLMIETGKQGRIYLIDRDNMGKINNPPNGPDLVVQTVTAGQTGVWGNPAFFQVNATTGIIYYHGSGDYLKGYTITNGHIDDTPANILKSSFFSRFPGTQPSVSADGTADPMNPVNGIVWELQVDNAAGRIQGVADNATAGPATLRAFTPTNLGNELYDSNQTGQRDFFGGSVKFTVPVVTNGHVLVGTADHFSVLGLFPQATAAPPAPSNLTGTLQSTPQGPQIKLNWTNPAPNPGADPTGIKIFRSTDGTNFTLYNAVNRNLTTFTDTGPFEFGQRYYYRVAATNQKGDSAPSNTVNVLVPIPPAVLTVTGTGASSIGLSWTGVANDHYDIERSADGTTFTRVATVPAFLTSYTDTGLAPGLYAYRIHAFNVNPDADSLSNAQGAWVGPTIDHSAPATAGFTNVTDLTSNGSAFVSGEHLLRLTDGANEAGSTFSNTRITVGRFTTSLQVRLHEGTQPNYADGFTFALQANAPTALGQGGQGIGYAGIDHSVAVKFSTFQHAGDPSNSSTGVVLNGADPGGGVDTTPSGVLLNSQNAKQITLTYDGITLSERIEDILTHQVFTASFAVNIPQVIGSDTAYVGFTGASSTFWELEDVLSWNFTSQAPVPGAPTNLRQTAFASSAIDLAWNSNSYNETGFQVERSLDGINFTAIGTTTATTFEDGGLPNGTYFYRVQALGAQANSPYSNTFEAGLLPQHQDIGGPAIPGSATFANGTYMVRGSGSDIWGTADHFHYLYWPLVGNGEIVARVVSEETASFATKAGVMFRESLAANAKNAYMLEFPPGGRNFPTYQWRADTGGPTMDHETSVAGVPIWLRLVRSGRIFSGYWAADMNGTPGPWNQLGAETVVMGPSVYVGLAVTSHNNSALITATFDHVQIVPAVQQTSHLDVSATSSGTPGTPVSVTVKALDQFNNVVSGYRGTVHFTSSDRQAVLPADYTFTAGDNGQHTFTVTLPTPGRQSVIVTDTATSAIRGLTQVPPVLNPPPVVTVDYSGGFASHLGLNGNGSASFPTPPAPVGAFVHQDIGTAGDPSPAGSASFSGGVYRVSGSGSDIWGDTGHFHYVYGSLSGDGEIVARVTHLDNTDYWAKAGVMIRESVDPHARQIDMILSAHNESSLQWRANPSGQSAAFDQGPNTGPIPGWVRLVRSGNNFSGYWAADVNGTPGPWHQAGSPVVINMGVNVLVGLAVTAHNNGAVNTSTFDHVTVMPTPPPPPPPPPTPARLTDAVAGQVGSILTKNRMGIVNFNTTFTFQIRSATGGVADGLTFVIQNDPRGPFALGAGDGGLGYGGNGGIRNSVAVKFDTWKPAGNHSSTGLYFDGHFPGNNNPPPDMFVDLAGTGIDFPAGARAMPPHTFRVDLTYDGMTLTEKITDLTTKATFSHAYTVDIPGAVGGNAAYVGFTGAAGEANVQEVQSWTGQFALSGPATHLAVSGPASTTAGVPFSVTVTALDSRNNQALTYGGTIHFTSSDRQAVLPAEYTFTPDDLGVHTFTVTLKTAGSQSITATDTRNPSITGTQSGIVVNPAAASTLVVAGYPSPTIRKDSHDFTVTAMDPYGNVATGYTGTVHFSSDEEHADLPDDYGFTVADMGAHTFSATFNRFGTFSLTATDTVNASITGTQSGIEVINRGQGEQSDGSGGADVGPDTRRGPPPYLPPSPGGDTEPGVKGTGYGTNPSPVGPELAPDGLAATLALGTLSQDDQGAFRAAADALFGSPDLLNLAAPLLAPW